MVLAIDVFLLKYKYVLLFYFIVIVFLLLHRSKVVVQAKIIVLYRTKLGLKWMEKVSQRWKEWVILLGYIGVGAGYVGLVFISYLLLKNIYDLVRMPAAAPGVSLVLPGINVPGLGVLPFWYWLIAIFIIAVVHEFAHGIVARAHNIPVKNTGIVLLGPIIGAFVEPDEKRLRREKDITQYSVFAAGAFANILLALLAIVSLNLVFFPTQQLMTEPIGFTFDAYYGEGYPFQRAANISPGTLIVGINGKTTTSFQEFNEELITFRPGEKITLTTMNKSKTDQTIVKNHTITLVSSPDNPSKGFLGISQIHNEARIKDRFQEGPAELFYYILNWWNGLLRWLFLLSLGIGLFNLLPLPIVDGGRMAQVFLHRLQGPAQGERRYRQISLFFLGILLLNLAYPLLVRLF